MQSRNLILLLLSVILVFSIYISLNSVSATTCWSYIANATCSADTSCNWRNDSWSTSGWCEEKNCWSLYSQSTCTATAVPGKNCTWQGGSTTYTCDKISCWTFSGTNESACTNNSQGLSCSWGSNCYSNGGGGPAASNCWSYSTQSTCLNSTGCSWGNCWDKGCWSYNDSTSCPRAKDWNRKNCTWDSTNSYCGENGCWKYNINQTHCENNSVSSQLTCEWKWSSCQTKDCWSWDYTNVSTCQNNTANLSCLWNSQYNMCNKKDCWSYSTQGDCQSKPDCIWRAYTTSGWCQEVNCWSWDSWQNGTAATCENNTYGLSCSWSGNPPGNITSGWCYRNIATTSCSNKTTERDCLDTMYCWWAYSDWNNASAGGTCNNPGSGGGGGGINTSILNEWNPGCYTFDTNATDCNFTIGCNHTGGNCVALNNTYGGNITANGLNCTYINSSGLCNNIGVLSSCCSWQNGTCAKNQLSTSCWDQMTAAPIGATFCEDYNSYENQALCEQIAGNPWYMPCKWDNSTSKCQFKASDVFGNESQSLTKIDNKKNCEAASGKWITENYCEGNVSVPTGRCEYKFDDEDNCNKACFACELKDSSGNSVNSTNARTACEGSGLGYCEYSANANASNGIGYCKAKEQFKKGIAGNCDDTCGDCTFKGKPGSNDTTQRPSYYCVNSKANAEGGGCKWVNDNSTVQGGYCVNKGEKTCEDACDRCKVQTDCSNTGRTSIANLSGSCKWQGDSNTGSCVANIGEDVEICWDGTDNTDDGLIDCADPSCYADTFCGFVSGDCFGWTTNSTCITAGCEWVTDMWGQWCDFKGSQCWKYNGNETACTGRITIINESLNITAARLNASHNINITFSFALGNNGSGWVIGSIFIKNASGYTLGGNNGNFTVDYQRRIINFSNNSYTVGVLTNVTFVDYQYYPATEKQNCQWNNGTGSGWCERDWSRAEVCMALNNTKCMQLNSSGCNWTVDSWCAGQGNSSTWCQTSGGGWCDHTDFKPKNCWSYTAGSSDCNNHTGCNWRTDTYSQPHCEVNWSGNCWQYSTNATCSGNTNCWWRNDTWGGWCANLADKCWSANETTCSSQTNNNSVSICYFQSSWGGGGSSGSSGWCQPTCYNGSITTSSDCTASPICNWKSESGWCEESEMAACSNMTNNNNQSSCTNTTGCRWKNPGWCDPKGGGFSAGAGVSAGGVGTAMGADCYKYDGNQSLCTNKTLINISCGWMQETNPRCEVNWGVSNCWSYSSVDSGCTGTNGCWWKNDTWGGWCMNLMDQCWNNVSYQSWNNTQWVGNCTGNSYCTNNSWGGCEPRCQTRINSTDCVSGVLNASCRWITGWCNAATMNQMFTGMESGAPVPLGADSCPEAGMQASVDLCGFGMKDMKDSFGFGGNVADFSNSSVCNKEKLSSFVMGMTTEHSGGGMGGSVATTFGTERTGSGNDTIIYLVYLDSDGATDGGCSLSHNSSAGGYEFRFKYTSEWNVSLAKAAETFNAYKCDDSTWKATDIKLSAWKKVMCGEIGGIMLAVTKADLVKFPTLYDSTKDMRVAVATIGNTGNITSPTDSAGPAWTTPGSIDFDIQNAFSYGADTAKFEDFLKKGFSEYEDCFNGVDDEGDGSIDCSDWDCQYASKCTTTGTNAAGYNDTSTPQVTGVKIEEYNDAALIMYDTNKPTNGSLELFGNGDTKCTNRTDIIYDVGSLKNNTVRQYKVWHTTLIYDDNSTANISINWPLVAGSTYNYKLKVCDNAGKCAVSRCSNFTLPISAAKCGYCNFVTRIKVPSSWNISYDVDRNGVYEHVQGQVCGPNAGMKTNYTSGRLVNVKLAKNDGTVYFEFINTSLTKTGLNDKVRTISGSGSIIADSNKVGLPAETRDKIINNLHPEICRIKVPFSGVCDKLYHCDDNGENCIERTSSATLLDATNCVWQVPFCEFSTYREATTTTSSSTSSSGGGGGGGGGAVSGGGTYSVTTEQLAAGYTKELLAADKLKLTISGQTHYVTLKSLTSSTATINVSSREQILTFEVGEEKKFDVTDDSISDLSVKLNSINSTAKKASITVKSISEALATQPTTTGQATQETGEEGGGQEQPTGGEAGAGEEKVSGKNALFWILLVVIILVAIALGYGLHKRKKDYKKGY